MIVDALEVVDIRHLQRERVAVAVRALDFGIRPFEEVAPVGKLGQAVRKPPVSQNPVGLAQFAVGAIERLGPLGDAPVRG